jgi:chromosome segregation ATPase
MRSIPAAIVAVLALASTQAGAQDQSTEDKLRDLLRRSTVDLHAAQASQAQLQSDRDAAIHQRDLLQQQLTAAQQQLADATAKLAQPQPQAAPPEDLKRLQDALDAAKRENAELAASNAKWQAAYRQAAALAQSKDAEAKRDGAALHAAQQESQLSQQTNEKLAGVCNDVLHLYATADFRSVWLHSYEPALGLAKVKLDNIVQDYEDRIYQLRLYAKPAQEP